MRTAEEILKGKGFTDEIIAGLDTRTKNTLAKKYEPTFSPPPADKAVVISLETITPKADGNSKFRGKPGQYLKLAFAGSEYRNISVRLCDGESLSAEGKTAATEFLTSLANGAADLVGDLNK